MVAASDFQSPEELILAIEAEFGEPRLTIELIPATAWGSNLRKALRPCHWNRLRFMAYHAANHRCEVCGGVGRRYRVACHERWHFDDASAVQRLMGVIALCPDCHDVKHFGRAGIQGRGPDALLTLCTVNDWSVEQANRYVRLSFELWEFRKRKAWRLDLDWIKQFDLKLRPQLSHEA